MDNVVSTKAEEFMDKVNKTYGLSLAEICVVKIKGKEYLKFYESDTNTIKMIENGNQSLNEYFKELQMKLSFAQSNNELNNAKNIFEFEEKYVRNSINLISVEYLKSNFYKYVTNLNMETINQLKFLLINSKNLDIKYISVDKLMYINGKQETLYLDQLANKTVIKKAETIIYEDSRINDLNIENIDYEGLIEKIDLTVVNDEPIVISGEIIDLVTLSNYIEYPELLDKQFNNKQITLKRKIIIENLIKAYQNKMQLNQNNKVLVYKYPNKAAFIDTLLLVIMCSALIVSALMFLI